MKQVFYLFLCLITLSCTVDNEQKTGYVFPSFTGNGGDGLHLLASYNGYDWQEVDNYKSVYQQQDGLMRDPSICRGSDGMYHMTHTTEWFDHRIALTHSEDLVNWTQTEFLYVWGDYAGIGTEESDGSSWAGNDLSNPVKRDSLVKNCWGPTIFYDDRTGEYVIYWATTIEHPDVFPDTWNPEIWENMNHRMCYIVTKDFKSYSPRKLFYAPEDHMVIDALVAKTGDDTYVMGIKEETKQQLHVVKSQKKLDSWVNMPSDFWEDLSDTEPFAGPNLPGVMVRSEGVAILKTGEEWLVYCDYWHIKGNGAFRTRDFETFTNISDEAQLPGWIRNGKIFEVPKSEVDRLLNYKTDGPGIVVEPILQATWSKCDTIPCTRNHMHDP